MEELLEVVLQRCASEQELVLQIVGAQNTEELDGASYMWLYRIIDGYTGLYRIIDGYTGLYRIIDGYMWLCN